MPRMQIRKLSKHFIWAVMALPAVWVMGRYGLDIITYGGAVYETGLWSAGFLVAALCVTPLRRVWPKTRAAKFAVRHRRALGVASFGFAALHAGIYLWRKVPLGRVLSEGLQPDLALGWIAFALFIALAMTSHNRAVRAMGTKWQALHNTVYIAAILTFAHAVLSSGRPQISFILLGIWIAAIGVRLAIRLRKDSRMAD